MNLDGSRQNRDPREILTDILRGVQAQVGRRANISPSGTPYKLADALAGTALIQAETDLDDVLRETHPSEAEIINLEAILTDFGFPRKLAKRATGSVNITLKANKSNTDFNPMFAVGDLIFIDSNGKKYDMTEDVALGASPTTSATAKVRAQELGADGNIDASEIVSVEFGNGDAESRWAANVQTYTNSAAFSGGRDDEERLDYLRRWQTSLAARPTSAVYGVKLAVERIVDPDAVFVKENTDDIPTADDKVFESTANTANSETINSAGGAGVVTKIAQKISIADWRFLHRIKSKLGSDSALVGKWRIETNNSGNPSGTLLKNRYEKTGCDYDGTNETTFDFADGEYPAAIDGAFPITAWLVFEATAGSGAHRGGTTGAAGDVKVFKDGAWSNDATVNKLYLSLIGGIPPRSFRVLVDVPSDKETSVAEAILSARTCGILGDGKKYKSVTVGGQTVKQPFELTTNVDVVLDITVKRNSTFTGTDDTKVQNKIKDIIVRYIGSTDTKGIKHNGLGFNDTIILHEIIHRVLDDDNIVGTIKVPLLRVGRKADFPAPSNLTASEEVDLSPNTPSERFRIAAVATDIRVTLQDP